MAIQRLNVKSKGLDFEVEYLNLSQASHDQRMSNLDFTLGIISQVMAKTAGGL